MDFGLVQETRLKKRCIEVPKGYNCFSDDKGVGTLILAKNKFKCELIPTTLDALNATVIKVKGTSINNSYIISLYIPCSTPKRDLVKDLGRLSNISINSPIVMGGDLNTGCDHQDKYIRTWISDNNHTFNLVSPK